MQSYIIRRIVATIPVMLIVAAVIFSMLRLMPGNPAAIIAGDSANAEQIALVHKKLGLDEPALVQFGTWVWRGVHGDFGESFFFKKQVIDLIGERLEPTLTLSLLTLTIAVSIAIPLGVLAAYKRGALIDQIVMGFSVMGFSIPVFVVGYVLIYIFGLKLGWLPVQGYASISEGVVPWLKQLIMPSVSLALVFVALIVRITRTSVVETLGDDYIRTARAKGQTEMKILFRHALKNAAAPIITVVGLGFAVLIGGVVVTESVFSIPGLGRLTVDAVLARDYPTVQAVILLFSFVYVLINLGIDLLYTVFDPRIKY
ncbi:ABC transporter permease [Burkholderia anthina]|uniref:ABC transporter permease n=1 Tax=Burkholderia anthina TaxID=179879 RepID=UPI00158CA19A|nr:ABC transporter permease [Burkholderia anthina]MBY4865144.1 ABC transporter permease [Burkholderia anthina]